MNNDALDSLKKSRTIIEEVLDITAQNLLLSRETAQALTVRNKELEALVVKNVDTYAKEITELRRVNQTMHDRLSAHAEARYQGPNRVPGEYNTFDNRGTRAKNVARLANAAIYHLRHNRCAIAEQLITPLAQGVHDVYKTNAGASGDTWQARRFHHAPAVRELGSTEWIETFAWN